MHRSFVSSLQDVDTGEVLMQAYADAAGIEETQQTGYAISSKAEL